ncbi:NAD(+) diphosphatase [Roseibium sp.]|uniref:NAD(+) diphosphatase n=1 Tax=Roseibium sp. TaxID=1936156 RepID=UPI003A9850A8
MTYADADARAAMSFLSNDLDRCSLKRPDTAWLKQRLEAKDAGIVLSNAHQLVLNTAGGDIDMRHTLVSALDLGALREEMIFLGQQADGSAPLFATAISKSDEEIEALDGITGIDLRTLALQRNLPDEDLSALAQARAMIHWHRTHKFCSRCGEATKLAEAGYRRDCPSCEGQHFPRTDPCVIMLITDGDRALLGRPPRLAPGIFTTLAGFMEPGETIEGAVRRETMEEAGISVGNVVLISNQPWPFPANLMLGCIGTATSSEIRMDENELEACRWCDRDEVRQMIDGNHPAGDMIPPSISIAHQLITAWLDGDISAP